MKNVEKKPIDAVCQIFTQDPDGDVGGGQGVFIGPDLVLMCWHIIEGSKYVMFKNKNGTITQIKGGVRSFEKPISMPPSSRLLSRLRRIS